MQNEIVHQIDPGEKNPRNSEGAFVTLKDGTILFAYTEFYGGRHDASAANVVLIRSSDEGRTWSGPPEILVANEGRENVMSVSFVQLPDGEILLFYMLKNGLTDCWGQVRRSSDEAKTWSEPVRVVTAPGYYVLNNDRVVRLASGRIVAPVSQHRCRGGEDASQLNFDRRGLFSCYLSDDDGRTWRESAGWWAFPDDPVSALQEPGVVELRDGRLMAWCRTTAGAQYGCFSSDGGETWTRPAPTELKSPCSPASIKRIPSTGDLLLVWNDHSGRFGVRPPGRWTAARTPLACALSRDECRSWQRHKLLEDDPECGYCYTAIHFTADAVLLAYCAGGAETGGILNRLRIRRVSLDWFYA